MKTIPGFRVVRGDAPYVGLGLKSRNYVLDNPCSLRTDRKSDEVLLDSNFKHIHFLRSDSESVEEPEISALTGHKAGGVFLQGFIGGPKEQVEFPVTDKLA